MSIRTQLGTIIGITCVAAFLTVEGHEVLGHGLAGYLYGVRLFHLVPTDMTFDLPTRLQIPHGISVADRWVAAAGALYNLVIGLVFYFLFVKMSRFSAEVRFFTWLLAALNLFDLPSYMVYSALTRTGDWETVVHGLPHEATLRLTMICGGALIYVLMTRVVASGLAPFTDSFWKLSLVPYFVIIVIFCAAAYINPHDRKNELISAFAGNAIGNMGLLVVAPWASRIRKRSPSRLSHIGASISWTVAGLGFTLLLLRIGLGVSWMM